VNSSLLNPLRSIILSASALIAFSGCQSTTPEPTASAPKAERITVRKSPNDQRDYRYLVLENKLKVLLVSDTKADKAAAALSVYRGSFHEPKDRPGLAHFLEHMLFIGTGKYPEVDSFQQYITANGGSSNAYTAQDHTNYFFDIQNSAFNEGLDRFGHFFIDPLLSPEYVDREKNAVHSEYQMQIKDDGWRGYMVSKLALNPEHPGSRFTIGSLDTLKGDVKADLMDFFAEHYSADQMGLVVLANQSLDELEALVTPLFNQVPNNDIGPSYPTKPAFTDLQLPAVLTSQSLKDSYQLAFNFPMPSTLGVYRNKPESYLSNLVGHEGEGSLHHFLNEKGWIESLGSGSQDFDRNTSLMIVNIELTEAGRGHVAEITDLLFQYFDMLRAQPPQDWLYQEQAQVAELGFRFQEQGSTVGFVYQMAPSLDLFPAEDLLVAPYLMEAFDPALIEEFLGYLTPENVLLEVTAPDASTEQIEPWFQVPFSLVKGPLPRKTVPDAPLRLPEANPYLPEKLDLVASDTQTMQRVIDKPELTLWLDTDVDFGTPRANMTVSMLVQDGFIEAADRAQAQLYRRLVNDALSTTVYPAYLAGLGYSIGVADSGFSVSVNGYQDKQMALLATVTEQLFGAEISAERFATLKGSLIKDWRNSLKDKPYIQAIGALSDLMVSSSWPATTLANALEPITLDDLLQWRSQRLQSVGVIAALHGNVTPADAEQLADFVTDTIKPKAVKRTRAQVAELETSLRLDVAVDHNDSTLLIYVQDSDDSFASRAKSGLAGQLLRSAYFSSLRTDQQLGYVVSAGPRRMEKRGGNIFLVQSPVASALAVETATVEFMQQYIDAWPELSDAEFNQQKSGLINRITESDKNLGDRSQRYWQDIYDDHYTLDSREQIAAQVDRLTKADMLAFFEDLQQRLGQRSVLIYSKGKFADIPTTGELLTTATALK
jgi:insulysin